MSHRLIVTVITFLALPFLTGTALAHEAGRTLSARSGDYMVDVDYSVPFLMPGEETIFQFSLITKPGTLDWDYMPYDLAHVRILKGDEVVLDRELPAVPPSLAFTSFTFPEAGEYTLNVAFSSGGTSIADASFPVTSGTGTTSVATVIAGIMVIVFLSAFIGAAVFFVRRLPRGEA